MEDDLNLKKKEDNLKFRKMEDELKLFKIGSRPHLFWKMEDKLNPR
jgi:hypothetical protein